MKEWLLAHGVQASIILVLVCYNILGTALVTILNKIELFLSPTDPINANPKIEVIKAWLSRSVGFASGIVDWLIGNKAH